MMDSKTLLQKLDGGDASNITLEVKAALNGPGCSALAHRLFKRIANLTLMKSKGSPEPVLSNNEETLQLALDCAQAILLDTPCDIMDSISPTIASVQIILYRFSGNKDILLVVKLLNTFLPILKKMSYTFCDKDKKNIQQMKQTVYNLLISLDNNVYKECHDSELSPLYLWDIFLHVNSLTENCQFEFILYCLKSITSKNEKLHLGDADQICAFNRTVIKKLLRYSTTNHWKVDKKGNVNQVFGILVSLLWQLCLPDLKSSNTGNLLSTLTHVSEFVASSFTSHPYHLECFKVISTLVKTFLVPTDAPSKEETFISGVQAILETLENDKVPTHPAISWVGYIAGSALSSMDQVARAMDLKHCLSTRVLSSINNFAQFLSRLLLSSGTTHCTGDDGKACPFQGDAILAFKSVNKFVTLCIDYKKDTEEWSELLPMVKESCDNLNLIVSKASEEGCVKAQLLKSSLSDVQYRVGILCYSTNNWKYGLIFLESQTRQLFALDHQMSSTDAQKLSSVLPRLSVCYENLQLKKKAKLALALGVIVNFKFNLSPSKFMQDKWAKLQNEDGDDITAEKLLRDKILLKTMCPQFSAGNELTLQITVWELSCYAANRMNKTNAILNAWKTLKGLKPSGFQLIEGSALACHALFSCNDLVGWYDVLAVSISEWLLQVKPQQKPAALCSMAAHYHIKFLIMAQEHFDENYTLVEEDVPKTYKFHGAVKKPEDVCNPADVCEIKSSFPNLNLHREQKLMDLLDAAVNYWDNSLESGLSVKDYASSPIVAASGDYLLNIAFFYSLWGHNSGATKAFQVCCTFARKMSIDDLLLQALSGLMNTIQVPEKCILEAENLLEHLKNHPKISYFHMVYNTSRAFQALRTGSFSEGFKALQDVINCPVTSSTIWCYAYAKILQASYQQIPLSKSVQSTNGVHDLVRSGLSRTIQSIQDRRLSQSPLTYAAVVHQALTSALWIGRYFLHRHMPRQARCYLKSELILALKLGLTTRAVEFMCELAMVDLLTENVDEATAKMYDIKSILDVTHIPSEQNCGDITSKDDGVFSQEEVVSNSKYAGTNLGCSPFLEKNEVFRIPILEHSLSCKCYLCSNVSVQIVWLMCGRIQAKINSLRFFVRDSHSTYTQIFKSANVIMKRLSANDPSSGASLQRHQLTRTLIYSKLDLVDMLVIYKKDKEALKENRHIFALLNDLKTDEDNLKLVTEEQQVCIAEMLMKISSKGEDPRTLNKTPDGISSRKASPSTVVDKTPETKGLWVTPVGPGKRRPPLKQVVSPNHLTVPLTDLQFYSPKVSMNLQNVIGRDDDGDDMFPSKLSKENVSRVPHRLINTFIKPEISGETSVSTCLPNGEEGNKDVKNVTTSKVSNLAQSSKARNMSKVIDNPASSRRRAPKPLPAAEISGETSVSSCLPNGEEGNKDVKNVTTSKVSNLAQSSKARDVSKVIDNPTSSRRRAPKPLPAEGGPLSQRQTLPLAEKAQSSRRKTSNALPNEEKPKSSRREAPTKSKISSVRTDTTSTDASKESMKVSVVRQTRQRKCS